MTGFGLRDDKTNSFDIRTNDPPGENFYPYPSDGNGFISPCILEDISKLLQANTVQNLIPSLNKPGYQGAGEPGNRGRLEGTVGF